MGLYNIATKPTAATINSFLQHYNMSTSIGATLQACLENLQLELGVPDNPLMYNFSIWGALVTDFWIKSLWEKIQAYEIDEAMLPPLTDPLANADAAAIKYLPSSEAFTNLGLFACPDGSTDVQLVKMQDKVEGWIKLVRNGYLPTGSLWKSYTLTLTWPKMWYVRILYSTRPPGPLFGPFRLLPHQLPWCIAHSKERMKVPSGCLLWNGSVQCCD